MTQELEFNIRGMRYCAKCWGPEDGQAVLAVHGWLDNAATFDVLAPLIQRCRIVAIDLAGHGLSDHYPPQVGYNIWSELPELLLLLDVLGWDKCHLLGHSRGATVCTLLAAVAPERIQSLFLMEGLLPLRWVDEDPATQLANSVRDNIKSGASKTSMYKSVEEAMRVRALKQKIEAEIVRGIVKRGLKKQGEEWTWRSDPAVTGASAFKLGEREKQSILGAVQSPGILLLAEEGFARVSEEIDEQRALCPSLSKEILPGHHHFHLDRQSKDIAALFSQHIERHKLS
jgi:pimeloyl-ACP methyl ester carboxylesterase